MRLTTFFALSSLAILGCRGDSNNNSDGNNGDSGSNGGSGVTIQQVQNDAMAPGTPVTLSGVVVTAIDNFGGKMGDIWVEEPEGGTYSGVHIFGANSTDVAALAVGDIVNVTGAVKDEFALTGSGGDTTGRTVTELKPATSGSMSVTKTGTGTVPAPVMVDALMIGQLADADTQGPMFSAAWEPYEGVLVTLNSVDALGAPKKFGSTGAADAFSFDITGVARVEGNFLDITMSGIQRNTCMNITGVVDYFFDYLVLPRSTADMNTGASGCPAPETTCSDNIDNDGNGFSDCKDNSCITTQTSCRMTTTIAAVDAAADANPTAPTFPVTGAVEIDNVYITAVAGETFWVSSSATAAASDGGLEVFATQTLPAGFVVGAKVNIIGNKLDAFNNDTMGEALTEFDFLDGSVVTGTGAQAPKVLTIAQMTTTATARPYVGSRVTLTGGPIKLTTAETTANHNTGVLTQGSTNIYINGTILKDMDAVNACYSTVSGILTYDVFNNAYEIMNDTAPTTGTGCP